jgi:hypothetical protein
MALPVRYKKLLSILKKGYKIQYAFECENSKLVKSVAYFKKVNIIGKKPSPLNYHKDILIGTLEVYNYSPVVPSGCLKRNEIIDLERIVLIDALVRFSQ